MIYNIFLWVPGPNFDSIIMKVPQRFIHIVAIRLIHFNNIISQYVQGYRGQKIGWKTQIPNSITDWNKYCQIYCQADKVQSELQSSFSIGNSLGNEVQKIMYWQTSNVRDVQFFFKSRNHLKNKYFLMHDWQTDWLSKLIAGCSLSHWCKMFTKNFSCLF